MQPETVNRKGLQVASPALKKPEVARGFERAGLSFRNALETQNRCLETLPPIKIVRFGH
jgi:hypothetical protein